MGVLRAVCLLAVLLGSAHCTEARRHDAWENAQWSGQYSDPYVRADHPQVKVHAQNGTLVELKVRPSPPCARRNATPTVCPALEPGVRAARHREAARRHGAHPGSVGAPHLAGHSRLLDSAAT